MISSVALLRGASRDAAAEGFVDLLVAGKFDPAIENFTPAMKEAMPAARLREVWEGVQGQVGPFQERAGSREASEGGFDVVYVACRFEAMTLDTKVVYDDAGKIAGLFFVPHTPPDAPELPDDSAAESYHEIEVVVGSDPWRLPGTLVVPRGEGSFPGLILVHGSGPHDRDETIGANRPFRDLALGLVTQGIVVLRYDKRTLAHGGALKSTGERLTLKEETVDDVVAAVDLLRRTDEVDRQRIYLLGHSLGGMALPRVARRSTDIAGLILVATPSRPLEDLILEQLEYLAALDGTVTAQERADRETMAERVARVKDPQRLERSEAADLPLGIGRVYWQDLARHRATTIAASLSHRLLVLQGGRDFQVTRQDFDGWKVTLAAHAAATFHFYPGLNHLLVEGDGPATPADYQQAGQVSRQVIDDIAAWILGHPGAA